MPATPVRNHLFSRARIHGTSPATTKDAFPRPGSAMGMKIVWTTVISFRIASNPPMAGTSSSVNQADAFRNLSNAIPTMTAEISQRKLVDTTSPEKLHNSGVETEGVCQ